MLAISILCAIVVLVIVLFTNIGNRVPSNRSEPPTPAGDTQRASGGRTLGHPAHGSGAQDGCGPA